MVKEQLHASELEKARSHEKQISLEKRILELKFEIDNTLRTERGDDEGLSYKSKVSMVAASDSLHTSIDNLASSSVFVIFRLCEKL